MKSSFFKIIPLIFLLLFITAQIGFAESNNFSIYLARKKAFIPTKANALLQNESRTKKHIPNVIWISKEQEKDLFTNTEYPPQKKMGIYDLEEKPFLSIDDIIFYSFSSHSLKLTPAAFKIIMNSEMRYFVVCVGKKQFYPGAILTTFTGKESCIFNSVVILKGEDDSTIKLQLGYPTLDDFVGYDPRLNPEIMSSLYAVGKLKGYSIFMEPWGIWAGNIFLGVVFVVGFLFLFFLKRDIYYKNDLFKLIKYFFGMCVFLWLLSCLIKVCPIWFDSDQMKILIPGYWEIVCLTYYSAAIYCLTRGIFGKKAKLILIIWGGIFTFGGSIILKTVLCGLP